MTRHELRRARPVAVRTSTSPRIISVPYLKDKHPSSRGSSPELEMILGLASTSSCPLPFSPVALKTISRKFRPTCGAARPTPSSLHSSLGRRVRNRVDVNAHRWRQRASSGQVSSAVGKKQERLEICEGPYWYMTSKSSSASSCNRSPNTLMVAFFALSLGSGYFTMSFNVRGLFHSKESAACGALPMRVHVVASVLMQIMHKQYVHMCVDTAIAT